MNRNSRIMAGILLFTFATFVSAQMTVSGTVVDASTGAPLAGANVVVDGTNKGSAADASGAFTINNVPNGSTLTASMIGYNNASIDAARTVNFELSSSILEMSGLEVLASRADERTPVAYTTVTKAEMEARLGSQDIPMSLNTTPSVYATQQGGGAGDARINVRGFNQRNVAVMINGVPQNDMENGWVYWSNWDGVGDATSSIQMQRGLSAVNLATPSIGGTMNIITDPAAHERGGKFKQELGAGNFLKTTLNLNTGLMMDDKLALSGTLVRKTGDGIIDKTWTDAWAYYLGMSYQMNDANRFELYAVGAPQRHGQNLYRQNMATYSQELAGDTDDFDATAYETGEKFETEAGREFNQNWGPVASSYTGQQYWYMYGVGGLFGGGENQDRHNSDFLNERENFFHKPLVNFNHYLTLSDNMRLSSILYWSGGSGGGTGTYGSVSRLPAVDGNAWYASSPWTWDWDAEIAQNSNNIDSTYSTTENRSTGILRNSINRQNTIGLISKLNFDLSDALKLQAGVDWRTAGIEHAREVRDLLGGDYYVDFADDNGPAEGKVVRLGDKIAYSNVTTVDWLGFFGQGSYSSGPISAYGMVGFSQIAYTYQDSFTVAQTIVDHGDPITATQFKGGAMYDLNDELSLFANFGIVEKPPILDNVIYYDGTVASDPANEKFQSLEAGVNYRSGNLAVKTNYYMTKWMDRNLTKSVTTGQGSSGDTDIIFLTGVDQDHSGLEVEASMQVMDMLRLDAAVGLGNWKFVNDATGEYQEAEFDSVGNVTGQTSTTYQYALNDLYVGDMPQTGIALGLTLTPIEGLSVQTLLNFYDKNYSDWSPDAREIVDGEADTDQVWMAPSYSKLNLHVNYDLPIDIAGTKMSAFFHVFNALDALYVQDATDHSQYNSYGDKVHAANNAEVFLGTPRYFNAGLTVNF